MRGFGNMESKKTANGNPGIKGKIISSLLKNEKRSTAELANDCGYQDRLNFKYSYVTRQLHRLEGKKKEENNDNENLEKYYIQSEKTKLPNGKPNPARYFWITPDLDIIRKLYFDKGYSSIQSEFQKSPWLIDLIIKNQHPHFGEYCEDFHVMCATSKIFFEVFLQHPFFNKKMEYLVPLMEKDPKEELLILIPDEEESIVTFYETDPVLYGSLTNIYHFFVFCTFIEYQDKIMTGKLEPELTNILDIMRKKALKYLPGGEAEVNQEKRRIEEEEEIKRELESNKNY